MKAVWIAVALGAAFPAQADVVDVAPSGMEIKHTVHIAAPPEKVWATLTSPARWWSSDHTFSGAASNLSFDARAGGCWCETLPGGGGVVHLTASFVAPPKTLVLRGSLGPFFNLAGDGAMSWNLAANDGTDVTLVFRIGGYVKDGFQKWAKPVDDVLGLQIGNLKKAVEAAP